MEELYIFSCSELGDKVEKTIDIFTSLAEAMSRPLKNRRFESTINVGATVMMKLIKRSTDIGGILDTLERVVLTLVEESYKQLEGNGLTYLPAFTRRQTAALEHFRSFDSGRSKRIVKEMDKLTRIVVGHRILLRKMTKAQEDCSISLSNIKTLEEDLALHTEMYNSNVEGVVIDKGEVARAITELHDDILDEKKAADAVFKTYFGLRQKEQELRTYMKKKADDYVKEIKILMEQRLTDGIEYLQDIVRELLPKDKREETLALINKIQVDDIIHKLLVGSTRKYVYPITEKHVMFDEMTIFGLDERVPEAVIYGRRDFHLIDNEKENQESYSTLTKVPKAKEFVNVTTTSGHCPEFLPTKPGMQINKMTSTATANIGFGWCRSNKIGKKTWGFFQCDNNVQ